MTEHHDELEQHAALNDALAPQSDPGPEVADKILRDLEELELQPKDVARNARRLRAHIEALREPAEFLDLVKQLAEFDLTSDTPGVAADPYGDEIIIACRTYAR